MKKLSIIILFMVFSFLTFSQMNFERGYYIDNDGSKINCFIKVRDWIDNPDRFQYRLDSLGKTLEKYIEEVNEFSVENDFRFIKAIIQIDKTDNKLEKLQENSSPLLELDTLFLKTHVLGKANLYSYRYKNLEKFFFNIGNGEIKQLIYKKYLVNNSYVKENKLYFDQLKSEVQCGGLNLSPDIKCDEKDLVNYFLNYNSCIGNKAIKYKRKSKRLTELFFSPSFGISYFNLYAWDKMAGFVDYKCENSIASTVGFEIQYILPFAKNRFGLIFEPSFQEISGSALDYVGEPRHIVYSVSNFSIGARYYLRLTPKSFFHFNPTFNYTHVRKYSSRSYYRDYSLQRFSAGVGFTYLNKYSIEFKIFPDFKSQSGFNQSGLLIRYTI